MNRTRRDEYTAVDEQQARSALQQLENDFEVKAAAAINSGESYYDTFNGDFYAGGYLLKKNKKKLVLAGFDGEIVAAGTAPEGLRFFPVDIVEPELRQQLWGVAGIRALIPICSRRIASEPFDLRNGDRKIVVRALYQYGSAVVDGQEAELQPLVRIDEVRGYESDFEKASELLADAGLAPTEGRNSLDLALAALEVPRPSYSSKYALALGDDIRLRDAVVTIGGYLLASMEVNHSGVIEDIDTEFLHDFRIAVRRTRSLLSQMKNYLPRQQLEFFQKEFKWLGSVTGPVRDLDVYLLMKEDYTDMLPRQLHRGLEEFFVELGRQRAEMLEIMNKGLTSDRYARLIREWKQFLEDDGESFPWPGAQQRCQPVVRKAIRRRFQKILKKGARIDAHSADNDLHSLRIQGKKLRYMLEFFRSFYAEKEIDFFHRQMKKLQNNLGDFNDIAVQLEMLEEYGNALRPGSKRSLRISAAVGGLITHLSQKHSKVRQKFEKTFSDFASTKNQKRFQQTLV